MSIFTSGMNHKYRTSWAPLPRLEKPHSPTKLDEPVIMSFNGGQSFQRNLTVQRPFEALQEMWGVIRSAAQKE